MRSLWIAFSLIMGLAGIANAQKISQFQNEPGASAQLSDAVVTESTQCALANGAPGNCRTTLQQILNTPGSSQYAPLAGLTWSLITATPTTLAGYGVATTGSGSAVLATSPTLVTPALGTPSAVVLTNATALPCAAMPALTGPITSSAGSCTTAQGNLGIEIDFFMSGVPGASAALPKLFSRATIIPASAAIKCNGLTGATASTTVTLKKNASSIGTLVFAASGSANQGCTVTFSSQVSFAAGDLLIASFPSSADATLGNIDISIPALQ